MSLLTVGIVKRSEIKVEDYEYDEWSGILHKLRNPSAFKTYQEIISYIVLSESLV